MERLARLRVERAGETVRRMAARSVLQPIPGRSRGTRWPIWSPFSPDLQEFVQRKRRKELAQVPAEVVRRPPAVAQQGGAPAEPFEMATAKAAFESTCNGCRSLGKVQQSPPRSEVEARELVARMVENGLNAELRKLEEIIFYHARPYKD